jgi:hypothetical protein
MYRWGGCDVGEYAAKKLLPSKMVVVAWNILVLS